MISVDAAKVKGPLSHSFNVYVGAGLIRGMQAQDDKRVLGHEEFELLRPLSLNDHFAEESPLI